MVSKRKTKKRLLKKIKRIGGDNSVNNSVDNSVNNSVDKSAYISYIKNTTTQILMNILSPHEKEHSKSTRYTTSHKTKIIGVWAKKVGLTDDEFTAKADSIINSRNAIIHPSVEDLAKMTENSLNLIDKYNLTDECIIESKILKHYIDTINKPKTKTLKNYTYRSSKA